ncbi:MAG: tol-pal system protein YbgF [Thiohalospira sp.]
MRRTGYLALAAALMAAPAAGQEEEQVRTDGGSGPLAERVERLERIVGSRALREMRERMTSLQREVQELRGQVQEQGHTIDQQRQRLRDLYDDLDRRLLAVERSGPTPGGGEAVSDLAPPESEGENEAYREAFDLLRELRYEEAVSAFRDFLEEYPESRYAHTAHYWVAEALYAQRRFEAAVEAYRDLLEAHPESSREAEARLKIGYSLDETGEQEEARSALEEVVEDFPDSTEAEQAEKRIRAIEQAEEEADDDGDTDDEANGEDEDSAGGNSE